MRRFVTVVTVSGLLMFSLAGPASAGSSSRCDRFRPRALENHYSSDVHEAYEAPVIRVTDEHTASKPLTLNYGQGPNLWVFDPIQGTWVGIVQDTVFHNFQVHTSRKQVGLNLRIEWPTPSKSDIDLGLYDGFGSHLYWSGAFNFPFVDVVGQAVLGPYSGGDGFEEIAGWPAGPCDGFTLETWSFVTAGENITMKIWLGKVSHDF